ncbi:P-loop containing nucleoside triphosphate hydrolase protein [Cladochytrium replicatum]|nr:P-loop containing nucleoside triphosphate hydrolase protein [Cladochytrium replicatum]
MAALPNNDSDRESADSVPTAVHQQLLDPDASNAPSSSQKQLLSPDSDMSLRLRVDPAERPAASSSTPARSSPLPRSPSPLNSASSLHKKKSLRELDFSALGTRRSQADFRHTHAPPATAAPATATSPTSPLSPDPSQQSPSYNIFRRMLNRFRPSSRATTVVGNNEDLEKQSSEGSSEKEKDVVGTPKKESAVGKYWLIWKDADRMTMTLMILGTVGGVINGAIPAILNLIIGYIVNLVQEYERTAPNYKGNLLMDLVVYVYALVGMAVGSMLAGYLQTYCWMMAAERQTKRIREEYFSSLVRQEIAWFDQNPPGEMATRISNDMNILYDGMAEKVGYTVQYFTSFLLGVIFAFWSSWQLCLVLLGCFPIPAIALNRMWHQVGVNSEKIQQAYSQAGGLAIAAFRSITTVMSNNGQDEEDRRYSDLLVDAYRVAVRIVTTNSWGVGIVTFFFYAVRTPVFYVGGLLVIQGSLRAGDAVSTFLQLSSGVMYLGNILGYVQSLSESSGAHSKIYSIISRSPKLDTFASEGQKLPEFKGGIELRNVTFSYPSRPDVKILNGLNLRVEPGQTAAVVGTSGSGKSTICQLVLRLYDTMDGEVLLDGVNVKDLNLRWLRRNMSLVSQEPVLFDGSIAENVAYGAANESDADGKVGDTSREDIEWACKAANAMEFARTFPEGLDTYIAKGTALSGGQKQRVAIARAIIRRPRILMLDEATSALDTRSERVVQGALDTLSKLQTTLVIAHRLSTIQNADVIFVMEAGRVIEKGTHDELMQAGGAYAAMVEAQTGGKHDDNGTEEEGDDESKAQQTIDAKEKDPDFPEIVSEHVGEDSRVREEGFVYGEDAMREDERAAGVEKRSVGLAFWKKRNVQFDEKKDPSTMSEPTEEEDESDEEELDEETRKERAEARRVAAIRKAEAKRLGSRPFPLQRLWEVSKLDWKFVVIGLAGSFSDGLLVPLEATLMAFNIGSYSNIDANGGYQSIILLSLLFLPLSALAFFAKSLQMYGFGIYGARLTERLRAAAFGRVVRQDMYFFDEPRHAAGELASRLAADADAVKRVAGQLLGQMLTVMVTSVVGMTIAFVYGWQLTLMMLGMAPLLFIATLIERKSLEGFTESAKKAYEESGQLASLVLTNIKTVVILAQEQTFIQKYSESLTLPHQIGKKRAGVRALGTGAFQSLMIVVYIGAFLFCYYLIINEIMRFKQISTVILNVILTSVAAGALAAAARNLTEGKVSANALFELIDRRATIDIEDDGFDEGKRREDVEIEVRIIGDDGQVQQTMPPSIPAGSHVDRQERAVVVQLQRVDFAFPSRPDVQVLKGVDIVIRDGEKVALVGGSGSGKSTIAALVQRLYDPVSGAVIFRGTDSHDWDVFSMRSQLGVVGQEPILFNRTIEDNIAYGCGDEVSFEDVQNAARLANIHDFIETLPSGYATMVGEMGGRLSGGQKQRIAIARAIVRKPRMLILDEATSALDSASERQVQAALQRASEGRTTLAIAHRLSTIEDYDRIYVLGEGKVVEEGTHTTLLAKRGVYYSMVVQQRMAAVVEGSDGVRVQSGNSSQPVVV